MNLRKPRFVRTAALWAAVLFASPTDALTGDGAGPSRGAEHDANLQRVRVLLDGNVRALWIGDSWSILQNSWRLPYGALLTWPIADVDAVCAGFRNGVVTNAADYTAGPGRMVYVNADRSWMTEVDQDAGQQYFGLPVLDATLTHGDSGLVLDQTWEGLPRIQSLYVNNSGIGAGDLPRFCAEGDRVRCRVLYYAPLNLDNLAARARLVDETQTVIGEADLRSGARPLWHRGENPTEGSVRVAVASQLNAVGSDVDLSTDSDVDPRIVIAEDPDFPLVGSGDYWAFSGAVFYHALADGSPRPGYYHSGLGGASWSFGGFALDRPSRGGKNFSNEQLLHWLDVTTLDRAQQPVVILHMATEDLDRDVIESRVRGIIQRFRDAFGAIGTMPPRFLLVGSYMHRIGGYSAAGSRVYIEDLCDLYRSLALNEPDCAYFSLYHATDGTFFTSDSIGGAGTQQAARDWLNSHGWATVSYGGKEYNLSSADNGGLDGVLVPDGVHLGSSPAAALYAKLLGDAIAASHCPGDVNLDGVVDTRDVVAFLNLWTTSDPAADFNGDGSINSIDVIAFLNAWNTPC